VWNALRAQLPGDSGVVYSLRLPDGGSERGIDFVVAIPGCGLAVLEVKGGRVEQKKRPDPHWEGQGASCGDFVSIHGLEP